jgi:hypothetical protein
VGLAGFCVLLASIAQWPTLRTQHAFDDTWFLLLVGWLETGEMGWIAYLLKPMNTHWLPAWKLLYYLQWRVWGAGETSAVAWHVPLILSQAAGAWCLGWLVQRYTRRWALTLLSAGVWATATIGTWDSPLVWLAAGCIAHSVNCLLLSLWGVAHYGLGRRFWHLWAWGWGTLAVLMWGAMLPLLVALPLQYLGFELPLRRRRGQHSVMARRFLVEWLVLSALLAVLLVVCSAQAIESRMGQRSEEDVLTALQGVPWQLSASLATLAPWPVRERLLAEPNAALGVAVAVLMLALAARPARRVVLLFLLLAVLYFAIIDFARPDLPFEAVARWGRYHYLPVLAWAPAVAAAAWLLLTGGARLLSSPHRVPVVTGLALLLSVAQAISQRNSAAHGAAENAQLFANERTWRDGWLEELRAISARAAVDDRDILLPDLPLAPAELQGRAFPLSGFVAVYMPEGLPHVEVVMPQDRTRVDLAGVLTWLDSEQGSQPVPQLRASLQFSQQLEQHLRWLERFARQQGVTIAVPDRRLLVPEVGTGSTLATAARTILGRAGREVSFVEPADWNEELRQKSLEQLAVGTGADAEFWRGMLEAALSSTESQ